MEDQAIIALYWDRSEAAIQETAQAYGALLHRLAINIVANEQDAEECVNDAYLQAWNSIPPHKPAHFCAFLATITRRLALGKLDYQHAAKRSADVVVLSDELANCLSAHTDDMDAQCDDRAIGRAISDFLWSQPERKRCVFVRRYWFADSVADIAKHFGMSQSAVKSTLHRTRNDLRRYLEKEEIAL